MRINEQYIPDIKIGKIEVERGGTIPYPKNPWDDPYLYTYITPNRDIMEDYNKIAEFIKGQQSKPVDQLTPKSAEELELEKQVDSLKKRLANLEENKRRKQNVEKLKFEIAKLTKQIESFPQV